MLETLARLLLGCFFVVLDGLDGLYGACTMYYVPCTQYYVRIIDRIMIRGVTGSSYACSVLCVCM